MALIPLEQLFRRHGSRYVESNDKLLPPYLRKAKVSDKTGKSSGTTDVLN
jgi:hypothetical protein